MGQVEYNDLREFIEAAKKVSDYRVIEGADWDKEIGALIEATSELVPQPPMLMFDNIKGYPPGFRVLSLPFASYKRVALALGLPTDKSKLEILRLASRKVKSARPIPPREVSTSPVMENVAKGNEVNLFKFPALHYHEGFTQARTFGRPQSGQDPRPQDRGARAAGSPPRQPRHRRPTGRRQDRRGDRQGTRDQETRRLGQRAGQEPRRAGRERHRLPGARFQGQGDHRTEDHPELQARDRQGGLSTAL